MNQLNLFIEVTRLTRPIGYMLLFWPCAWGLTIAIDFSKVNYGSQILLSNVFSILNKGDGEIFAIVKKMLIDQNFKIVNI